MENKQQHTEATTQDELPPLEEHVQKGPGGFTVEQWAELSGNSEYWLMLYVVFDPMLEKKLDTLGDIFTFIEDRGEMIDKFGFK